ncbi:DUF6053 domain-containing protein [Lysobacter enzymogenes]
MRAGRPSGPTPLLQLATNGPEGIGPEGPPTKAKSSGLRRSL